MTKKNPEPTHQDPAEPNEVGTEVETTPQPDVLEDDAELKTELEAAEDTADGLPQTESVPAGTVGLLDDYTVSPEAGYRRNIGS